MKLYRGQSCRDRDGYEWKIVDYKPADPRDTFPWLGMRVDPETKRKEYQWFTDTGSWSVAGQCSCDLVVTK